MMREEAFAFWAEQLGYLNRSQIQHILRENIPLDQLERGGALSRDQMEHLRFFLLKQSLLQEARAAGYLDEKQYNSLLQDRLKEFREGRSVMHLTSVEQGLVPVDFVRKTADRLAGEGVLRYEECRILAGILSRLAEHVQGSRKAPPPPPLGDETSDFSTMPPSFFAVKKEPDKSIAESLCVQQRALSELKPGSTLGPYEILEDIGGGGMGKVYKAFCQSLGRIVAIKIMRRPTEGKSRFLEEARITASLKHPNIVTIYDVGSAGGMDYMVMDFVHGKSLEQSLKTERFTTRKSLKIMKEVALAIHYAHERGIVHCDLKPANIIIEDGTGSPKLLDFGIAENINLSISQRGTWNSDFQGTPQYMAPEQAAGENDKISPATDVYALGAIIYEMLCGVVAVQGENCLDILYKIGEGKIIAPSNYNPALAGPLDSLCLKALEVDPSLRYQSAKEFAIDIERFLESGRKSRRSSMPRMGSQTQKGKLIAAGILIFVLLATLGIWAAFSGQPSGNLPEEKKSKIKSDAGSRLETPQKNERRAEPGEHGVNSSHSPQAKETAPPPMTSDAKLASARLSMVEALRQQLAAPDAEPILSAMASLPMELFIPPHCWDFLYQERAVPGALYQTISSPSLTMHMFYWLEPKPDYRALYLRSGTGYEVALLSKLVKEVWVIEPDAEVAGICGRNLKKVGITNVNIMVGDPLKCENIKGAFDVAVSKCACREVPIEVLRKLKVRGRCVLPLGNEYRQELTVLLKTEDGFQKFPMPGEVRFTMMPESH